MLRFLVLGATILSSPAFAQLAGDQAAPQQGAREEIPDIIVTATRREARLQDVPVTVSAISSETLAAAGITDTTQLTQLIPGLVATGRASTYFQPAIRGITTTQSSAGVESPVALYVDGIYQPYMQGVAMKLADISRVEVLRGPQGTLFGRNASGGLINVITKDPTASPEASVELRYGRFDQKTLSAYGGTGLGGNVSASVSLYATDEDGYIKDRVRGGVVDGERTIAARTKLKWTPTDDFTATLAASYIDSRNDSLVALQPTGDVSIGYFIDPTAERPSGPNEYLGNVAPTAKLRQWSGSLQLGWQFDGLRLDSATGYQDNKSSFAYDSGDVSPVLVRDIALSQPAKYFTQEVRLSSDADQRLSWIVGGYYFQSSGTAEPLIVRTTVPVVTVVPFPVTPLTLTPGVTTINSRQRAVSYAGFGQATYMLTDNISIIAGARYTWEKRKFDQNINNALIFHVSDVFKNFSPMASIQYRPAKGYNLYATYSTGFKSGTYNAFAASRDAVRPEKVENFEIGLKADVNRAIRLNLSAFAFKYSDQQVETRQPGAVSTSFINAGTSNVKGMEAELTLAPSSHLSVHATAAYLDAKYKSFDNGPLYSLTSINGVIAGYDVRFTSLAGNRMVRAPEWTFSIAPELTYPVGQGELSVSGNLYYSSRIYFDPGNTASQKPYALVNGNVTYSFSDNKYAISLWGSNLTNTHVLTNIAIAQFSAQGSYDRPRSYGVALRARF